jgi:hypothetical protein
VTRTPAVEVGTGADMAAEKAGSAMQAQPSGLV